MAHTENSFYAAVAKVAADHALTECQRSMVEMYCAENGSDCGVNCWDVAVSTLEMLLDQGTLKSKEVCGMFS
jgi:hypothetical protein